MCGRFALVATGEEVAAHYQLPETPFIAPRYNIAPTCLLYTSRCV